MFRISLTFHKVHLIEGYSKLLTAARCLPLWTLTWLLCSLRFTTIYNWQEVRCESLARSLESPVTSLHCTVEDRGWYSRWLPSSEKWARTRQSQDWALTLSLSHSALSLLVLGSSCWSDGPERTEAGQPGRECSPRWSQTRSGHSLQMSRESIITLHYQCATVTQSSAHMVLIIHFTRHSVIKRSIFNRKTLYGMVYWCILYCRSTCYQTNWRSW